MMAIIDNDYLAWKEQLLQRFPQALDNPVRAGLCREAFAAGKKAGLARQEGEDGATAAPSVAEEKAESVCVHCFSPPHMWGMICCKDYWNDPRTEFLTETQANARRAARSGGGG